MTVENRPSNEELQKVIAATGSIRKAARQFGVHHKTVQRWLAEKGNGHPAIDDQVHDPRVLLAEVVELRKRAQTIETAAVSIALALVGGNVRQAADLLDMSHRTLDSMLRNRLAHLRSKTLRRPGRPPANAA